MSAHSHSRKTWVWLLLFAACRHVPTERERQGAMIHYDLGIQQQQTGDVQGAFKEFQTALEMDPGLAEAHNAVGLVLHLAFKRYEEAIKHFQAALQIRPDFSEVRTNLGNLYLDEEHYDEAIRLYQEALNDMLYPTPFIAQGNLGWALFKKGEVRPAVDHIKAAVTLNPKFCLGYKNLGTIYESEKDTEGACKQFDKYKDHCPDVADAYYKAGLCQGKLGHAEEAKQDFAACQAKAGQNEQLRDDCRQLQEKLQ